LNARGSCRPCVAWCAVTALLVSGAGLAGTAYRYKDANGQWVYTDRPPPSLKSESVPLGGSGVASPRMAVMPRSTPRGVELVAINGCVCVAEFAVVARTVDGEHKGRGVVAPQSEQVLVEIEARDAPSQARYEYGYVVGDPAAQHRPTQPYRAPFAVAQTFEVTQAPPDGVTHVTPGSRQAIDIAMPVGTAVYAAREGVVINVAAKHFRSGLTPQSVDAANFVDILHDDGTHAIYAHLQLDTVRVRPGQRVARGEYLANSGNTGFSSGPHLHFVVLRNAGMRSDSVPVTFAGPAGASVVPVTGQELVAY
jgi:murein DD-endopeptidase MepM/ murein hydrolase activator NlpD